MPRKLKFSLFIYFLCTKLKTTTDFCVNMYKMLNLCTRYHIPQFSAAFLHLLRPAVLPFLQLQHSNSLNDTLASGKVVHSGFQFLIDLSPVWHVQHVAPAVTTLANCSSDVLHKSCFGWRKSIQFMASIVNNY